MCPTKAQRHKEKVKGLRKGRCVLSETFAIIAVKNVPRRREGGKKNFTSEDTEGTEKDNIHVAREGAKTQRKNYSSEDRGAQRKIHCVLSETIGHIAV